MEPVMWKWKDLEKPAAPVQPDVTARPASEPATPYVPVKPTAKEVYPVDVPKPPAAGRADIAKIGKSVMVKGELSGSEDLYLDGEVEGSIELRGHSLTIGPNGRVRANVPAQDEVIHGQVS